LPLTPTPAPWPCWSIAAARTASSPQVAAFLAALQPHVVRFNSPKSRAGPAIEFVHETFGQQKEDVVEWLTSVKWEERLPEVSEETVRKTLAVLEKAGVVQPREGGWDMDMFVNREVATVVA
jgi:protoporphyrinogen oxidase